MKNVRILPLGSKYAILNILNYLAVKIGIISYFNFKFKEGTLIVDKNFIRYKDIRFRYKGIYQFKNSIMLIHDIYLVKPYAQLNVYDKVVVDIGAAIGDTAIMFKMLGAKKVIAFEPFPYSYNIAKGNILDNFKYGKAIHLVNKAVGKQGSITIRENYKSNLSSSLLDFRDGIRIEIMSLDKLVSRYKIPPHSIIKIDCEGSELDVIKNASLKTLGLFDQIILEYEDNYTAISDALKSAKFKVKKTPDKYNNKNGILYAYR
jgi:FkbM family methyltransferase